MNTKVIKQAGITLLHVKGHIPREFWSESYHAHDHAEVFIHVRGQMELFIEGNVYYHSGNEIRVYAPMELHFGKCDSDQDMEWYQISLDRSFLNTHPALSDRITGRPKGCQNVFISKKHETVISLIEEIFKKQDSPLADHYVYANIIKTLCILNEPENNIDVQMGKNECLQEILEIVNKNLTQIKTVENIAELSHYSASYIHRLFKKHLNITPHKYVIMKKLSLAKELLSNGATISNACFNSGFDDYANFITAFRKHFGVTPKNHQKANT